MDIAKEAAEFEWDSGNIGKNKKAWGLRRRKRRSIPGRPQSYS